MNPELWEKMLRFRHVTESGCWEWTRSRDGNGYGRMRIGKRLHRAHRLAAAMFHGLDLDDRDQLARHKCDNPPCFNPDHIEPGTHTDNMRDSIARGRMPAPPYGLPGMYVGRPRGTHCKQGHPFEGDNVVVQKNGRRYCRECRRALNRAYMRRQAAVTSRRRVNA